MLTIIRNLYKLKADTIFSSNNVKSQSANIKAAFRRCYFEEKYTSEESVRILKILNDEAKSEADLSKFIISAKRAGEILKMKTDKGSFSHLDDLIPIIGIRMLEKFYGSMLEKKSLGLGNPMYPILSIEKIERYKTVLSFSLTGNRLAWCKMTIVNKSDLEKGMKLLVDEIGYKTFDLTPKTHFLNLLSQMRSVVESLPKCELVVCEEFPTQVPSPYMFSIYLQLTQARSMFLSLLFSHSQPQIVSIKSVAVAKLFNTYIGNERVSGQVVVEDWLKSPTIECRDRELDLYLDADSEKRECLALSVLLNLAYWKITNQLNIPIPS